MYNRHSSEAGIVHLYALNLMLFHDTLPFGVDAWTIRHER